jgi:hypothetical protein
MDPKSTACLHVVAPDFCFDDGSVVFHIESTQLRVHRSIYLRINACPLVKLLDRSFLTHYLPAFFFSLDNASVIVMLDETTENRVETDWLYKLSAGLYNISTRLVLASLPDLGLETALDGIDRASRPA